MWCMGVCAHVWLVCMRPTHLETWKLSLHAPMSQGVCPRAEYSSTSIKMREKQSCQIDSGAMDIPGVNLQHDGR